MVFSLIDAWPVTSGACSTSQPHSPTPTGAAIHTDSPVGVFRTERKGQTAGTSLGTFRTTNLGGT